jgi:hypothetical protein
VLSLFSFSERKKKQIAATPSTTAMLTPTYVLIIDFSSLVIRPAYI